MRWIGWMSGMCLGLVAAAAQAEPLKPVYTSLQDCPAIKSIALPERVVTASRYEGLRRCKGVAGYDLVVVDQDPRSFLVLEVGGRVHSLEEPMVRLFPLGHFPDISTTKAVEWRVDGRGRPAGFIVRVHYQDPNVPATAAAAQRSTLMVFDLRSLPPRMIGMTTDNAAARRLADGGL
jgi:hypothetical protein